MQSSACPYDQLSHSRARNVATAGWTRGRWPAGTWRVRYRERCRVESGMTNEDMVSY